MRRRDVIGIVGAAAVSPLSARAQQMALPVVGFLNSGSADLFSTRVLTFRQGLRETGYVEGRNVAIEFRWAEEQYDRLPELAADLVRRGSAVIATNAPLVAQTAKAATTTIPIVFAIGSDPVSDGLVASMNRPGGNVTGVSFLAVEIGPKLLELLHEVVPATTFGLLINPSNVALAGPTARALQTAARTLGLELHVLHASTEREFEAVFANLAKLKAGGVVMGPDPLFGTRLEQLASLALRHAMPAIYLDRRFAEVGGLMSYGASIEAAWRLVGLYAGRILKGTKPTDLPVMQPTRFEFVLNLKTAKALALDIPLKLHAFADEVIE